MTDYVVDYAYVVPGWDTVTVSASNKAEAEQFALEDIRETFPEYTDVIVETVVEVRTDGKN